MSEGALSTSMGPLGPRLREARTRAGLSLRATARALGVSPSFISQMENGKSQPSVATLYALGQLLGVSVDELFATEADTPGGREEEAPPAPPADGGRRAGRGTARAARSDFGSPVHAFPRQAQSRVSVTHPGERARLEMNTGVVWERLATNTGRDFDFMEIVYPPHSSSTTDGTMLQHAGYEFGYLLEGELEITAGFEVFRIKAGDAMGMDSSLPHLLTNPGDVPARGIWFVAHPR